MNVLAVQLDTVWQDKAANFEKVRSMLAEARPQPCSLTVLPEMFATGFSLDVAAIAEKTGGPTHRFLGELAKQYTSYVVGGMVTSRGRRGRNLAMLYRRGAYNPVRYCKVHPFSYAGEADYYTPGRYLGTAGVAEFSACMMICYDLRFPELFRRAARRGVQLFVVIANWPRERHDHWRTLLRARAIENQAYVVGVNRCGRDPEHDYAGGSAIIDYQGRVMAEADDAETVLAASFDLEALLQWRDEFPALRDTLPDYDALKV